MSQVSSRNCHLANSSQYAASNCGPRSWSGSVALNRLATAPLGHVRRRFDGSYSGRKSFGCTARMPDTPSTSTSRQSDVVSPTIAMRLHLPLARGVSPHTIERTHSDPRRVFPNPRPDSTSQIFQSPCGGNCSGRAQKSQRYKSCSAPSSPSSASIALRCSSGNWEKRSAREDKWLSYFPKENLIRLL